MNNTQRHDFLQSAISKVYDLIVVGGGVTGCGIALDAASRGLKTLLVEKSDFASGTSSKSTKLIHGGLRYLKQLEFGLVRETGIERAVVHRLVPHLVHPEKMFLPIVDGGTFGKMSASLAISVYDFLANVEAVDQKETLSREEAIDLEPLVKSDFLSGGIVYSEYRTDDARLTIELMKKAAVLSCDCFNYMEMKNGLYDDEGKIIGVECYDVISDRLCQFTGTNVVSAAGPWVDGIRKEDGSFKGSKLFLTKGVHIVVDREKLNLNQSVYFDDFNGRMLFAIPRGKITYVGTTDTSYQEDLDRVVANAEDVEYILSAVNHYFDIVPLEIDDIQSTWAGLRPLIHQEGKSPTELSRKDEIFEAPSGLISIAGGKLTGYRKMAMRIVDLVLDKNPSFDQSISGTHEIKLGENEFEDYREVKFFIERFEIDVIAYGLEKYHGWYLITTYGKEVKKILNLMKEQKRESPEENLILAELQYGIAEESVWHPLDLLQRRTGRLYFDIESVQKYKTLVIDACANHFNADTKLIDKWKTEVDQALGDALAFKKGLA